MKLTVAIPVFNERATILEAINEAKRLKLDREIIVVDNHSTDGTRQILEDLQDDSVRIIFQPKNPLRPISHWIGCGRQSLRKRFSERICHHLKSKWRRPPKKKTCPWKSAKK